MGSVRDIIRDAKIRAVAAKRAPSRLELSAEQFPDQTQMEVEEWL
jgi:hypothetical protein